MRAWAIAAVLLGMGCGGAEKPAPGGGASAGDTAAAGGDGGGGGSGAAGGGAGGGEGGGSDAGGEVGGGSGATGGGTGGSDTGGAGGSDTGGTGGSDTGATGGSDTGGTGGTTGGGSGGDTGAADPDSDGDGFPDSAEATAGTDPADRYSRPYAGGYTLATCAPRPTATGPRGTTGSSGGGTRALYQAGDIVSDLALVDQYGDTVDLASFCDHDILIILAAAWCGACRAEAAGLEALQASWGASGVQVVVLLVENTARTTPSAADAATWATTYGLRSVPVLAVRSRADWTAFERDMAFPSAIHLTPGLRVDSVDQGADDPAAW